MTRVQVRATLTEGRHRPTPANMNARFCYADRSRRRKSESEIRSGSQNKGVPRSAHEERNCETNRFGYHKKPIVRSCAKFCLVAARPPCICPGRCPSLLYAAVQLEEDWSTKELILLRLLLDRPVWPHACTTITPRGGLQCFSPSAGGFFPVNIHRLPLGG